MEKEGAESGVVSFQKGDPVAIASLEACPDPYFESFNYVGTVEAVMATGDVAVRFGEHQHTFKPGALVQVPRLFVGDFVKLVDDIRTNGWLKLDDCYKEKAQACGGICVVLNAGDTSHDGIRVTLGEDQHYISQLHLDFVARRLEGETMKNEECGLFYAKSLEGDRFKLLQDSMRNLPDVDIGFSCTCRNVACGDMVKVSRDMTSFLPWLLRKNTLEFAYKRKASDDVAAHSDLKKWWDTLLEPGKVVEVNFDGNAVVEFTSGSAWRIRSTFLQLVKQTGIGSFGQRENSSKYISSEECSQGRRRASDDVLVKQVAYFLKNVTEVSNLPGRSQSTNETENMRV